MGGHPALNKKALLSQQKREFQLVTYIFVYVDVFPSATLKIHRKKYVCGSFQAPHIVSAIEEGI